MTSQISCPIRVLFLCTGNSGRSQLAEALLQKKGGDRFVVASAGTAPSSEIRPEVVKALADRGIDWTDRRPKGLEAVSRQQWDFVITLCDRMKEKCPALPGQPIFAHWGIPDPSEIADPIRRATAFKDTLSLLAWRIDLMLALRVDAVERLVVEQRLRAIGARSALTPSSSNGEPRASLA